MANHRQITVEPADNGSSAAGGDMGKANYAGLKQMFSTAPYFNEYDKDAVKALGQERLLDGEVNDSGHTFGTFNRDYSANNPPNYADVETGGGGLPASAWVPNPASPIGGPNNVSSIPEAPEGYGTVPADNWGNGGTAVDRSPHASSAAISSQKIGDLPSNRSS
jgi:hypothetical protein